MGHDTKVVCVLCQRYKETKITGPLSTKHSVTAHQNCLLYSSGIYCQSSPEFDDLFGFSVEDVKEEVKRGTKLYCNKCRQRGATVGCEVKRCKRSYHYPCAVEEGAVNVEDNVKGKYELYCNQHSVQKEEGTKHRPASSTSEPSKHLKTSKKPNEDASSKRRLISNGRQEGTPSKLKFSGWKKKIQDDCSNSDEEKPDIAMFAPLESDLEESANSNPEQQAMPEFIRHKAESPTPSSSGNHLVGQSRGGTKEEDEMLLYTDAESQSLLLPVMVCMSSETSQATGSCLGTCDDSTHPPHLHTTRPSSPQRGSTNPAPCPGYSKPLGDTSSPLCTNLEVSPAPPENNHIPPPFSRTTSTPRPHPPLTVSLTPVREPSLNAANFWKDCNAAGCTLDIFSDFIAEMSNISHRIHSNRASQEDYDVALRVMEASGKLTEIVAKQQEELKKRQTELERAAAAMRKVVSSLRR